LPEVLKQKNIVGSINIKKYFEIVAIKNGGFVQLCTNSYNTNPKSLVIDFLEFPADAKNGTRW
jgi:hypothetical protein